MQSVMSALSLFQRFLNCQTKPILIGRFALLLRDWMYAARSEAAGIGF